jgi:hypothetical protein
MPAGQSEPDEALESPNDWRVGHGAAAKPERGGEVFQRDRELDSGVCHGGEPAQRPGRRRPEHRQ